ncbi:MAG: KdsC family phosphatase [Prevotella sp.]|jgi:3-deoxy-D-manno-octulosonate 8-phosphate phosphatase (KDO 8-P phosphatase)
MINYDLKKIKAVVLDVDGVLSASTIGMDENGEPVRTLNIKDGYAIQLACKRGLIIAIMTGGHNESIKKRYGYLGVKEIFLNCAMKIETYEKFMKRHGLTDEEVIYIGDDVPDYQIMRRVGCPCCPSDACSDIKNISLYISQIEGGHGCVRDVLEQVLVAQDKWLGDEKAFGW